MTNKADLMRELGFGDDVNGFEVWSDSEALRGLGIYEEVPAYLAQMLRDANAAAQQIGSDD